MDGRGAPRSEVGVVNGGGGETVAPPAIVSIPSGGIRWTRVALPRRLSRGFFVLYAGAALLGAAFIAMEALGAYVFVSALNLVSYLLLVLSFAFSLTERIAPGVLQVFEHGVHLVHGSKVHVLEDDQIRGVYFVERVVGGQGMPTVEIEHANGDRFAVRTSDFATARQAIELLRAHQTTPRTLVRLALPTRRLLHLPLAVGASTVGSLATIAVSILFREQMFTAVVSVAFVIGAFLLMRRFVAPPVLDIGDDAVVLTKGFAGSRRVSFERASTMLEGPLLDEARRTSALHMLAESAYRASQARVSPERLRALERQGRDLTTWRANAAASLGEGQYRVAASIATDVEAALRSPHATPEQRIGAALALRATEDAPARIRIAARSLADERVREALEAVADDDDAALARAMKRLGT